MIAPSSRWRTHLLRLLVGAFIVGVPALVLMPAVGRARSCYQFHHDHIYFTKDATGLSFIPTDGPIYAPEHAGLPPDATVYTAEAWTRWSRQWRGVERSFNHTLRLGSLYDMGDPSTLTPADLDQVYTRYAANLRSHGIDPDTADLFLKGPGVITRIDWQRVCSLLLSVGVGLGVLYAVGWGVNTAITETFRRPGRDIDPETGRLIRCPACKYDLNGLSTDICPECGRHNAIPSQGTGQTL